MPLPLSPANGTEAKNDKGAELGGIELYGGDWDGLLLGSRVREEGGRSKIEDRGWV